MSKILITGYKGFIGKNLYNKLFFSTNIIQLLNENYLTLSDWKNYLEKLLNNYNPNIIFHVGACANTLESDVNFMMIRNYESTKIIAEWTNKNNRMLIYSSSAAIYGNNNEHPSNLYGWSKYVGENVVTYNGGISLRYFNVYGPGEEHKGNMASVVYQKFIDNKNNKAIKIFPGKPTRDFIYVDDVVNANIFASENYNNIEKKYYEVGSGESRTFEDALNIMKISYSYYDENVIPKGYQFNTKSDSKLWLPGWKPEYTLEKGLTEYKKYLKNE